MATRRELDGATQTETTGHEWDGIRELDTPMPRWWLWTLYATIVWGVIYISMVAMSAVASCASSPAFASRCVAISAATLARLE